jgi:hypothetical protein
MCRTLKEDLAINSFVRSGSMLIKRACSYFSLGSPERHTPRTLRGRQSACSSVDWITEWLIGRQPASFPITSVEKILSSTRIRAKFVRQSRNPETKWVFHNVFTEPTTIGAVRSRVSSLFAAKTIKLCLAGASSPDFRRLQDQGKIVLINCVGPRITGGMRLLLLALSSQISASAFFCSKAQTAVLIVRG